MTRPEPMKVFDSQSQDYQRAFQVFLDHTDQKRNARRFLQSVVDGLGERKLFIDAGAGNGEVSRTFAGSFGRTVAIEPNRHLLEELKRAVPQAETICEPILKATPKGRGDFVLCSHTFYYIPAEEWLTHLERLVSWMSPAGVTVVVLQNRDTDCMTMLEHFFGHRFDLDGLTGAFRAKHGDRYEAVTTLDPAYVEASDLATAFAAAEFLLNVLPIRRPPARHDVEAWLAQHAATANGGYRFSVHQDFLQIRRRQ